MVFCPLFLSKLHHLCGMKVILIDNYDSFTYNLVHYLEQLDCLVDVIRNDDPRLDEIVADPKAYDGMMLSPGPGLPKESGRLMEMIEVFKGQIPIFGVCLGMQALAEADGGMLYNRDGVMHGRAVCMAPTEAAEGSLVLQGVRDFQVALYHSWAVQESSLPCGWTVMARALHDEAPMVMENADLKAFAVQFHPESILTPEGLKMIGNWVQFLRQHQHTAS
jgi:anthranilate synthase component 2